jgi:hypothetical protein
VNIAEYFQDRALMLEVQLRGWRWVCVRGGWGDVCRCEPRYSHQDGRVRAGNHAQALTAPPVVILKESASGGRLKDPVVRHYTNLTLTPTRSFPSITSTSHST